jgi:hypothetical protein
MVTREDLKRWEARGCPRELDIVEQFPRRQDRLAYVDDADIIDGVGTSKH